jgi:hypothetical protein
MDLYGTSSTRLRYDVAQLSNQLHSEPLPWSMSLQSTTIIVQHKMCPREWGLENRTIDFLWNECLSSISELTKH